MIKAPECVSDMIRVLQQELNKILNNHGQIHMDRRTSALVVYNLGRIAQHAANLENAWSQAEWNRRAAADRLELLKHISAEAEEVLGLMKPGGPKANVVVPFPPRPTTPQPPTPPGGNAA
ncbi:hypothetical protein QE369_002961 [Agrobacterium larrymoorei]|uniref:Uncharacterized protein n=1 Tax=Agrobacterium larrymoorei TaxID=160699 RepID=A0AAJ2BBV8_9HYPH|nr:hypothetical protein [Agrobacterium larrymoorei]MDR6102764.1 hypothetical protein [Agrobacterium larrymoorei]